MAQINGKDVKTYISLDAGVTWLQLVCEQDGEITRSKNTTTTPTKCGPKASAGVSEWSVPIAGVVETAPAGTEISYEQLSAAYEADTALKVRIANPDPAGTDFYHVGDCLLTEITLSLPVADLASFSGTLTGSGTLDITP